MLQNVIGERLVQWYQNDFERLGLLDKTATCGRHLFLLSCLAFGTMRFKYFLVLSHMMGERCNALYFPVMAAKLHQSPLKVIGILPNLYAQSTFGICLALNFLFKGLTDQLPDTLGWSPSILCTCHSSPASKTHPPLFRIFEAGLHDSVRDIYEVCLIQLTFRKILTHA